VGRVLLTLALVALPRAASATYSIAAADQAAGEVGGTSASCVGNLDLAVIYGAVPGVGVIHAQARLNTAGRDRGVADLQAGLTPEEVIMDLTRTAFDPQFQTRQYGVVDLMGRAAGFTGSEDGAWAGHQTGRAGPLTYAVQGNLLTGPAVVSQAEAGLLAPGCDLAERLMHALEAGRENGEGDARCTGRGVPADAAFLRVDGAAGGAPVVSLGVQNTGRQDPVALLRAQFDAWRTQHPCPTPPDAGVEADAAAPDADAPPDAEPVEAGAPDATAPSDASPQDALPRDGSPQDGLPSEAGADGGTTRARIGSTCACRQPGAEATPWAALLPLALVRALRQRCTSSKRSSRNAK
jgi:uncharacterized Ntn-hydrolase superfamily protein